MLFHIPDVLDAQELQLLRQTLAQAGPAWVDGRVTAGYQGAAVKFNQQIDEASTVARDCQRVVLAAVENHSQFISAAVPNTIYPPMFNRYGEGMTFGAHIDGSIRVLAAGSKLRTDLSATLFLSEPEDYDGGELLIHEATGVRKVRYKAGDMVLYPSTSLHQVSPITRGERLACFFWVESLVRDDAQRTILYELDQAIQTLNAADADAQARRTLAGVYHNLIRQWAVT
ncbi:MAG: Fe2+-dependent dioxygenase [Janthinobacterium lividum]